MLSIINLHSLILSPLKEQETCTTLLLAFLLYASLVAAISNPFIAAPSSLDSNDRFGLTQHHRPSPFLSLLDNAPTLTRQAYPPSPTNATDRIRPMTVSMLWVDRAATFGFTKTRNAATLKSPRLGLSCGMERRSPAIHPTSQKMARALTAKPPASSTWAPTLPLSRPELPAT